MVNIKLNINIKIYLIFSYILIFQFFFYFIKFNPIWACDSTLYNFNTFYESTQIYDYNANFNAIFNSLNKFVINSNSSITKVFNDYNLNTNEIKVLMNVQILPNYELNDTLSTTILNSIEIHLISLFKIYNIKVIDSIETNLIFKNLSLDFEKNKVFILTPDILEKLYTNYSIFAVIDILLCDVSQIKCYQLNLNMPADDRREILVLDKYIAKMRYKITQCNNGNIIWIDEVIGNSDDSYYFSFFEKGIILNIKQVCIDESALNYSLYKLQK